jgi:hypothetical protein
MAKPLLRGFEEFEQEPHASLLVTGVTSENFRTLASAFIARKGEGFLLAKKNVLAADGSTIRATVRELEAWERYFQKIGVPTRSLHSRPYYAVPAQWPWLFDAGETPPRSVVGVD